MMNFKYFQNLRVVELSSVLAGPAVGMFFAELGAQVIKIENARTGGDVTRSWKLPSESPDALFSAYYSAVNWGKEVHLVDLSEPSEQVRIHRLIASADLVISNFPSATATKLGMDFDTLKGVHPQLLMAQITGFGNQSNRVAFDLVLQAEAGFLYMNGNPDSPPVKMPVALIDLLAAHQLKEGILAALLERSLQQDAPPQPTLVTVSLLDAAIASLANQATNWLMAAHIPQPMGTLHPNIAPYGEILETADGKQMVLAVGSDAQFVKLCDILGISEVAADPLLATNKQRVINRSQLLVRLQAAAMYYTADKLHTEFVRHGIPAGRIRTMPEVFEMPEAQALILHQTLPDGTSAQMVKTAVFEVS